ncbi:ATP-binding protein [Paraglaciecola sp.]|uniref:ATP-binding protein n=1 Tax=Paraglaciecola sp. TaxID=1920173 RepID=UPI0030F43A41
MKKIYLGIIFTVIGSLVLLGWLLDQVVETNIEQSAPGELILYQKMLRGMAAQLDNVKSDALQSSVAHFSKQFDLALTLEQSANLALPEELSQKLTEAKMLALQSESVTFFIYSLDSHPDYLLQLSVPSDEPQGRYLDIALTLLLYTGIGLALVIWLVPLTKRLSLLSKVATKFGQGNLEARISPSTFSYISNLEQCFNRMAGQIEKLVADNKMLAGSISHDLRTPVACLRFGVEAALSCNDTKQKQRYLERFEQDLTRMENMLEAFLDFASMERQAMTLKPALHEINGMVRGTISELAPIAQQKHLNIEFHSKTNPVQLLIDYHWFFRALLNLLSNAVDYCHSTINIELYVEHGQVMLSVHDDGPGVPPEEQQNIFTAFVTKDKSRNRQSTSFGLGLAIVERVAQWHGGTIKVSTSPLLGGACFTMALPERSPLIRAVDD